MSMGRLDLPMSTVQVDETTSVRSPNTEVGT